MSAIQSNVGLITGIPIVDTVDQLIAVSAQPRNSLAARNAGIAAERTAVDALAAQVLSLQFSTNRFNAASTFNGRTAASSSDNVSVSVAAGATPPAGSFQFTPLQSASAQQFVSGSFDDITEAIGDGSLGFRFGGRVDQGLDLSQLNDGQGVGSGQVRITDRSGASAVIDLRAAQTVDDVLLAINSSVDVNVTASADGDSFTITDDSGGTGSLNVQDVGLGTTAADLGFSGQAVSAETITGADVFGLTTGSELATLNDGVGIRTITGVDDLTVTLSDGTGFGTDLSGAQSLGDVIDAINNDEDNSGGLTATINADGDGLLLTDTTGGTGNLVIGNTSADIGSAATDLGIATGEGGVAAATVDGSPLVAGLADTLVSSLNGGRGFTLGEININTRSNTDVAVDLSSAETLGQIVSLINDASPDISATINGAGNGIEITDNTSGGGNLTITDVGAGTTTVDLGIAIDAAQASVNSGSLNQQVISESTLLSSLNGGEGIDVGNFFITDSSGDQELVNLVALGDNEDATIGDVIDAINTAGNGVLASINSTGDGIQLTDTADGDGTLTVTEAGSGTTAAGLNLLGASTATDGEGRQVIDGSTGFSVDLSDLEQSAGAVSLSTLNGGSGIDDELFQVIAANGESFVVDLGVPGQEAFTIDDVINQINEAADDAGVAVTAALNSAGTGIELTDNTGGDGLLTVNDLAQGTTAADLNLAGESAPTTDGDPPTINGSGLFTAVDPDQGALQTLADRINALEAGVTASVLQDSNGFRLAISVNEPGAANQIVIDTGATGFSFTQTSQAQDAVALFGPANTGGGIAVSSTDNQFNGLIDGVNLTVNQATGETATIDIATDDSPFIDAVEDFVDAFNAIRGNLDTVTAFNPDNQTTGILFGRLEALRVDTDLGSLVSGTLIFGAQFGSLASVGVNVNDDGTLSIDSSELADAFATDPAGVEQLFTAEQNGLVAQVTSTIDALAAGENSLLSSRSAALTSTIEVNDARIADFDTALDAERTQLLEQFVQLEQTIALLQSNLNTLSAITPISATGAPIG